MWFDKEVGKSDKDRNVLLFMDNASVNTSVLADFEGLRHTKVVFFPSNMTSVCQPLDAGIIQTFKLAYRNNLHTHIMRRLDDDIQCNPFVDISIVLVICWVTRAWKQVSARTISQCFKKCGFHKHGSVQLNADFLRVRVLT